MTRRICSKEKHYIIIVTLKSDVYFLSNANLRGFCLYNIVIYCVVSPFWDAFSCEEEKEGAKKKKKKHTSTLKGAWLPLVLILMVMLFGILVMISVIDVTALRLFRCPLPKQATISPKISFLEIRIQRIFSQRDKGSSLIFLEIALKYIVTWRLNTLCARGAVLGFSWSNAILIRRRTFLSFNY